MKSNKHSHYHRNKHQQWFIKNIKWIIIIVFFLVLGLLVTLLENRKLKINEVEMFNDILVKETMNNYDAMITIIDGETEETFTKAWGSIISEGYPICSNLVIDSVGKEKYMNWKTIEALNDVGVEFILHPYDHSGFRDVSNEEVEEYIGNGIEVMKKHGLESKLIVWTSNTSDEIYELGRKYFDGGFAYSDEIDTTIRQEADSIKIQYKYNASNYSYQQLMGLINSAIEKNSWLILFTRNPNMDEEHINIYRQAFEYAKEHNVAVVTASEGYDLYYGNKLGNH